MKMGSTGGKAVFGGCKLAGGCSFGLQAIALPAVSVCLWQRRTPLTFFSLALK